MKDSATRWSRNRNNRLEQEMRCNSQLLRSRNPICPEEWKHEDATHLLITNDDGLEDLAAKRFRKSAA